MPDLSALDDILMEVAQTEYMSPGRASVEARTRDNGFLTPTQDRTSGSDFHYGYNNTFPRRSVAHHSWSPPPKSPELRIEDKDDPKNGSMALPCPFGTYLDLQFVEFCNNLSWVKRVPYSIRRFRQATAKRKKKWRKSMDQMLYTELVLQNQTQQTDVVYEERSSDVVDSSFSFETRTPVKSQSDALYELKEQACSSGKQDASPSPLHEALSHFDEALECFARRDARKLTPLIEEEEISHQRPLPNLTSLIPAPICREDRDSLFIVPNSTPPRSAERSERSCGESFHYPTALSTISERTEEADTNNTWDSDRQDSLRSSSAASTTKGMVPAEALESIREKLAAGVKQMKELQAQVDTIPDLMNQISALQKEIFLRDERDAMFSPAAAAAGAVSFLQLHAPELIEGYLKWSKEPVAVPELCPATPARCETCEKEVQTVKGNVGVEKETATVLVEMTSFGVNTDPCEPEMESSFEPEEPLQPTLQSKRRSRVKSARRNKIAAAKKNKQRQRVRRVQPRILHEVTGEENPCFDDSLELNLTDAVTELEIIPPESSEEPEVPMQSPSRDQQSNPDSEACDSIPESGVPPSRSNSDADAQQLSHNGSSPSESRLSSQHSEGHCSEDMNEGCYELKNGELSDKCFAENEQSEEALLTQFTCRPSINKEMMAACKVLNDAIQRDGPTKAQKSNKNVTSLNIIQREWFPKTSGALIDPLLVSDYLDAFEDLSKALLQVIVNLTDENGNTLMHYALSQNNFDVVSLLLDSRVCDVDILNRAGYTSLMLASLAELETSHHQAIVGRLFQLGDVNKKAHQHGQTALMLAVSHGRLTTVRLLLEVGADVNIQDNDGSTALMCASEHGHIEIVRVLLSHPEIDTGIVDQDGMAALYIALEAGNKEIAALIYAKTSSVTKLSTMSVSMSDKVIDGEDRRKISKGKSKTATM